MGTDRVRLIIKREPQQGVVVLNIVNPALNIQVLAAMKLRDEVALSVPFFPKIDDSACSRASPCRLNYRLEEILLEPRIGDLFEIRVCHQTISGKSNRMATTIIEPSEDMKKFV